MNNLSNLKDLKGFASKMREQARDAAKKLPSFDEMAAKDDYIHKEEFNVKGEKGENEGGAESQNSQQNSSSDAPSPWSLIDQRIFQKEAAESSSLPSIPQNEEVQVSFHKSNPTEVDEERPLIANDPPIEAAPTPKPRQLMMSVVTDAMIAKPAAPEKAEEDETSVASDSSSDSDSWNEGDEEDPILQMMRQSKGGDDKPQQKKKKPKKSKKKSSSKEEEKPKMHRFLADMADAENQLETNSQSNEEEQAAPGISSSSIPLSLPATPKELGSWMKNMASNQMNKILRRPDPASQSTASTAAPPLASTWKSSKPAPNPLQEENFHSEDSKNLLGVDELKQLAMLKKVNFSGGKLSAMMGALYEYRQFAFILFTLIFAGVVYFFKFSELEDGVS
mmetsp:Transcript_21053/g.51801  ORF Transcript_21053/g.51801 Transcript_21053/m.51801 type:complete len:392 (-) Transcript_21053:43-1218(-)